ncbi:MAG: hypothetical protein M0Z41_13905 [Peptococcaceae bacterium]|jgi:hypothetical protein|nr:hypothetical protein [Peptococcaceae bacterium]
MSIRVIDLAGRVCHPIPPKQAAREIERDQAHWVHADGIEPNILKGTIQLTRPMKDPPDSNRQTQVLDGDGIFLVWIWAPAAGRLVSQHMAEMIGAESEAGYPQTILVPRLARHEPEVIAALTRLEAMRAIDSVAARDQLRHQINYALSTCRTWDEVEARVEWLLEQCLHSPADNQVVLAQLRILRRKLRNLDLALAPDMEYIREQLAQPSISQ